ncbi:cyclic nucleotide-gated cation channel alpha-3-like, partial [Paramuricea clavata]
MADVALEVLQNLGEEAKDVVYYEALHRVHGENNDGQGEKEPNKWSTVRRRMATTMRTNSVFGINGRPQEQATNNTSYFFSGNSFIGNTLTKITRIYSRLRGVIVDPESDLYYFWMGTVAFAVLYNFWVIILRLTFLEMRSQVRDQGKLWRNYKQKSYFVSDVISIFPLNFIVNFLQDPLLSQMLRIPRLFKWHTISDMFEMSDSRTSKPYGVRALKLTIYLAIIIHWFACFYFMICEYEGLGSTGWTYPELKGNDDRFIRKYIKSLFWAALTLTTIGENESPETTLEYVFTGCTFLIGVLLFATIVGNMGDVISSMNAARAEFQERMDGIKRYMEHHEIPEQLQDRVKRWLQYSWSRLLQQLDKITSLSQLVDKLRTEIAIHVHLETLKKVKIFKDCEQGFLCELVLKLRSQIFSPEDYICRIGEIGREMYIINHGKVEVVVRDSSSGDPIVVASLSDGNYFGEISLLRLDGGTNRRTADVRSVGYSELLCLSKKDLMEALKEYPEAHEILEAQGRDRLQRTKTEKNAMRLRTKNKDTAEEDFNSIDDGVKELKSLVEQLKCFDKLEEKLQTTQLQNQCNALRLQVEEVEIELKKSRKRSYALERMLLSRSNGFYDTTKEYEELNNSRETTERTNEATSRTRDQERNKIYFSLSNEPFSPKELSMNSGTVH